VTKAKAQPAPIYPADFPIGSLQSRAAARAMLDAKHPEGLEIISPMGFLIEDDRVHVSPWRYTTGGRTRFISCRPGTSWPHTDPTKIC
jgi:hypothetical protein